MIFNECQDKLNAYEVLYNEEMTSIRSIKPILNINPNTTLLKDFPTNYLSKTLPIIWFPLNEPKLPKRAFVYYSGIN